MVEEYGGKARFVVENYGDSELARRFGVTRYPAIFVDDVLVATPKDFGFYGKGEGGGGGRYAPLRSEASHARFRADLARMIDLLLAGETAAARAGAASATEEAIPALPALTFTNLDGGSVPAASLTGRVVVVEFWATWCPPCRPTLRWLDELARRHPDDLTVVAVAIESDTLAVQKVAREMGGPFVWVMGGAELARAFGDVSAVPTLFVFDRQGRTRATAFGAPPDLHARIERRVGDLVAAAPAR